jgi:hypothetical protein
VGAYRELLAYFDSLSTRYPFGIPKVHSALQEGPSPGKLEVLFIGEIQGGSGSDPFEGSEGELLKSAVTKGLKLETSRIGVINCREASRDDVLQRLKSFRPKCIVVMGKCPLVSEGSAHGEWSTLDEIPLLYTHSLASVVNDQAMKREFWESLKKVLKFLGA